MAGDIFLIFVFAVLTIFGFVAIIVGWTDSKRIAADSNVPRWRVVLTRIGLVFLTLQALMLVSLFTPLATHDYFLSHCFQTEFLFLAIGIPCWLLGKTQLRWWLLGSSFFFSVASFFVVLAETAY